MMNQDRVKNGFTIFIQRKRRLSFLIFGFMFGLIITTVTLLDLIKTVPETWQRMQPSTCLTAQTCFCEALHLNEGVRQPANTVSSYGFVFIGMLIIALSLNLSTKARLPPLYGAVLGIMTVIVGLGSAFYHASLTFTGQFFDILGMYLVASFVLLYAFERLYQVAHRTIVVFYIVLNAFLTVIQILSPDLRRYTFAVVLVIGLLVEGAYLRRRPVIRVRWFIVGLSTFALAYGIWILDNSRLVCSPESLLQGHAVWHIMGAVAVLCLFFYYASEPVVSQ
jgi:hypothetical protein